tara:strand:- start:56 stop:292 length:237 start_codon:yes stop_codon:yes gene_type:complete
MTTVRVRQKHIDKIVTSVETVEVDGKWVQKNISKTINEPQFKEVDLYNEEGEIVGKHTIPIMEQFGTLEKQDEWVEIE